MRSSDALQLLKALRAHPADVRRLTSRAVLVERISSGTGSKRALGAILRDPNRAACTCASLVRGQQRSSSPAARTLFVRIVHSPSIDAHDTDQVLYIPLLS